jgi:hypothetical protein
MMTTITPVTFLAQEIQSETLCNPRASDHPVRRVLPSIGEPIQAAANGDEILEIQGGFASPLT